MLSQDLGSLRLAGTRRLAARLERDLGDTADNRCRVAASADRRCLVDGTSSSGVPESLHARWVPRARPCAGRARRGLRLGQVNVGAGALPGRRDRLFRRPACGGRQRSARPGRLRRRFQPARADRRGPASPGPRDRCGHPRVRRRRRRGWLGRAHAAGLPASIVLFDTPAELCRSATPPASGRSRRASSPNSCAHHGVPRRRSTRRDGTSSSPLRRTSTHGPGRRLTPPVPEKESRPRRRSSGLRARRRLQVSRFPWGEDPGDWLRAVARAAADSGFQGIALMDHLIQIPQVGTAWEPIPEPWVSLGMIAGLDTDLRLGTLVSPVTFRPPGILAKTAATLDVRLADGHSSDSEPAGGSASMLPSAYRSRRPRRAWICSTDDRDRPRALGQWHQAARRASSDPSRDHLLPAPGLTDPDHRRRGRRTAYSPDRRRARRRLQLRYAEDPWTRRSPCSAGTAPTSGATPARWP